MHRERSHTTWLLLLVFLVGGVLAPVAHQIQHGVHVLADGPAHHDAHHVHPDFDAISDDAPHLQNTDLTCILCSFSLTGAADNPSHAGLPDNDTFLYHGESSYQIVHGSFHSIRGPPAYS